MVLTLRYSHGARSGHLNTGGNGTGSTARKRPDGTVPGVKSYIQRRRARKQQAADIRQLTARLTAAGLGNVVILPNPNRIQEQS